MEPETCADVERAAELHLDRVEGKAAQPVTQSVTITDERLSPQEVARRIGYLLLEGARHAQEEKEREMLNVMGFASGTSRSVMTATAMPADSDPRSRND